MLATLWPGYWDTLTTRATPDEHAQARELLEGRGIATPDAFTGTDLATLMKMSASERPLSRPATARSPNTWLEYLS